MPGIVKEGNRILASAQQFADAVYDAVADFFKNDQKAAEAGLKRTETRAAARHEIASKKAYAAVMKEQTVVTAGRSGESGLIVKGLGKLVRSGARLVEIPLAVFVMKPINWALKGGASLFTHFRHGAPILTALGVTAGVANWYTNRHAAAEQQQAEQEMQFLQMQQALAAQAAEAPSYKNVALSGAETARLGALDTGKAAQGGHTAALTAAREAKATEAAASAAPVAAL